MGSNETENIFIAFLFVYIATVKDNVIIVVTIVCSPELIDCPMYFFLAFLSLLDEFFSSVTTPEMVVDSLYDRKTISFEGCMMQLFAEHFLEAVEVIVLTTVVYDHYVAVCKPLPCSSVVNWKVANSGSTCIIIFSVLFVSYGVILCSLKSHSSEGQWKALFTFGAHIAIVILFFVPCIFIYESSSSAFSFDKFVAIFYTIPTPLLNPFIYAFRNKDTKKKCNEESLEGIHGDY
ncbi:olfactory receptor 4C15-like [Meriones unguiculatus]|uniref:olfactory receptor 4C15-like n=1 Tax=Meriones unguiculatus TaxID=10047 RepID=UPI00293F5E10|nr:olfactory receptor 4C15-like [Meriones unguiculatus]